jgi:hypothetical protein
MADERDPKLSQHYRDLEPLEPPRELDQKILAAAHAPRLAPSGRHRWYYSLAAAAVLVFAVALTMHIERQQPDREASPAASAPVPRAEEPRASEAKPSAPAPAPAAETARTMSDRAAAPARSAQVDEMRAPNEVSAQQRAATEAAQADTQLRERREVTTMQRYAAPPEKPERWLERIAELRSRGKHEEADKALAEFKRAYPDYRISEVMRERVEGR